MLVFGQISGAIFFGPTVAGMLIAAFVVVDLLVFYVGLRSFKREEILPKLS
jgi:hypothetical protein